MDENQVRCVRRLKLKADCRGRAALRHSLAGLAARVLARRLPCTRGHAYGHEVTPLASPAASV